MTKGRENKPHIGIFGRRNSGKSSLINAITGQDVAIVSEVAGTTTDPVKKSVEIFGIGPAIIIDTAGTDDKGTLGELRISRTMAVLDQIDLAVLVISSNKFGKPETGLLEFFSKKDIPYIILHNKADCGPLKDDNKRKIKDLTRKEVIEYSAHDPVKYNEGLIRAMKGTIPATAYQMKGLLGDILSEGDIILLITPIDSEAPEGRMILPQVQVIRDIMDNNAVAVVCKETEVETFLGKTNITPALAITDSQIFARANAMIPPSIPLTSFSIILARQKGDFKAYIEGTRKISHLKDYDRVLMLESCSHQVSCDDIGRVKIPAWLTKFTGRRLYFDTVAGLDKLPHAIDEYALVIQCGGCMITHKQLVNRLRNAKEKNVAVTNYGMAIAYIHGIFDRAIEPFKK